MKNENSILIDRRGFLKSAAMLAGATALDVSSTPPAQASSGQSLTTLSFWSAGAFVDPGTISSGDATLLRHGVRVSIEHYGLPEGESPLLRGFSAVFIVKNGRQSEYLPFFAWAPSSPAKRAGFFMPVSPANGILFAVSLNDAQDPSESYYLSVGSAPNTAKLHTGTYVIAAGSPSYAGLSPRHVDGAIELVGPNHSAPNFEYLLIEIAKG